MSLTGDALTDRLVSVASRLVGAVRQDDFEEVGAAFDEARELCKDEPVNGTEALSVVLAAMVPWNVQPSELLAWYQHMSAFAMMLEAGVDPATAATLISQKWDHR